MNKIAVFLFLPFFAFTAQAQRYWTLEECVNTGLANNLTLKQRELNQKSAEADYFQSRMGMLPNLNASASNNWNTGFAIDPVTNASIRDKTFRSNNFGISSSVNLFSGLQTTNNIRLQKNNTLVSNQDYVSTKNTIALSICNAYLLTLQNIELLESRRLQLESTKLQVQKQEALYALGGSGKARVLQLRAQLSSEELNVVTAENNLSQSYLSLWQTMNIVPDTSNQLKKPEWDATKVQDETRSAAEVYKVFAERSPEVKSAELRTRSAQLSRRIAEGGRSPRISLTGSMNSFYTTQSLNYTTSTYLAPFGVDGSGNPSGVYYPATRILSSSVVPFSDQIDKNLGKNLGLSLSVPIFNQWQVNNNIKKSTISEMSAQLNEQQVKNDTYKSVSQAWLDFKSAMKRYESNIRNLDANKESAALSEAQFNLGAMGLNDYLQSKNAYLQAETNYLQAKYELIFRRKVLDFYLGNPLY